MSWSLEEIAPEDLPLFFTAVAVGPQ